MIRTDQNESHDNSKTSSHENQQRNGDQKKRAATSKRTRGKHVKQPRRNRNGKRNVALENQGGNNKNTKRGPPSRPLPGRLQSDKNQRTGHSREGRKEIITINTLLNPKHQVLSMQREERISPVNVRKEDLLLEHKDVVLLFIKMRMKLPVCCRW